MVSKVASGFATTRSGKLSILERTRQHLISSVLVCAAPIDGVKMEHIDFLRKAIPETTKAAIVKNSIMRIALKDTVFEPMIPAIKNENMFFFIPEGDFIPTLNGFKSFQQESRRLGSKFTFTIGAIENQLIAGRELENILGIPSRVQLIGRLLHSLKAAPSALVDRLRQLALKLPPSSPNAANVSSTL